MVDLSSLKPTKPGEDSPPSPSGSDQSSPSNLPLNQSLKEKPAGTTDKAAFPPLKEEEKMVTTEQKEIEKELSEIGISPKGSSKKTRIIMATLGVLLLVATLPAAVYLVKQRQEIRKEAYIGESCVVDKDCSNHPYEKCSNGKCVAVTPPDEICTGGVDEDGDGKTDCDDPDCASTSGCQVGFCGGCNKAEGWISSNQGPTECNGTKCNTGGWNYCCWDEDHNNTCDICARGGGPGVDCSGNCISLSGLTPGSTVKFCSFYSNNDVSCPYSTGSLNCSNVNVPSNGSITRCISDDKCGQLEADGYCGVCKDTGCGGPPPSEPPESPPPSLPPDTALCQFCKIYDEDWNEITDLSTLTISQTIYLATRGTTSNPQGITKARIRVNGGDWQETTQQHGNKFYIQYTIPSAGSYTVESMVYNPDLGWY